MIDVIIPAYNAHETILKTLASIALQKNADQLKVYIIDDCSNVGYEKECNLFKDRLNINLFKLEKNMGPGYARQYGIDVSNGKYIVFIDSDDSFFDYNSCEMLFSEIDKSKKDVVSGQILETYLENLYVYGERFDVLHGKIYRRSFLRKNDIRFSNEYNSEDEAFNNLLLIHNPNIGIIDEIVYVYKRRETSLTMQNDYYSKKHIKAVCDNLKWVVNSAEEKKCDKSRIAKVIISTFGYLYYYFYPKMKDVNLKYVYDVLNIYKKYNKYANTDEKRHTIQYWTSVMDKFPIEMSFEEFINKIDKKYKKN